MINTQNRWLIDSEIDPTTFDWLLWENISQTFSNDQSTSSGQCNDSSVGMNDSVNGRSESGCESENVFFFSVSHPHD